MSDSLSPKGTMLAIGDREEKGTAPVHLQCSDFGLRGDKVTEPKCSVVSESGGSPAACCPPP